MKTIVQTEKAPAAIGPYSQACHNGRLLFTSGQIALDPATQTLAGEDIQTQTRQVLKNLQAVIEAAGARLGDVLKVGIYLRDMADYPALNAVYAEFFPAAPPARHAVAVSGLPMDVLVEMEAVVALPGEAGGA